MIVINGIERQLEFNIFGIEKMQDKNEDRSNIASIYAMVWGGMEGARYANELQKDYSFKDVVTAIDAMGAEDRSALVKNATSLFTESQAYKSLVPVASVEASEEEEKKSQSQKSDTIT